MVTKTNYILLHELSNIEGLSKSVNEFIDEHNHNNGWAYTWYIHDPKENNDYSESRIAINNYFISLGLEKNDTVIIHSKW